MSALAPPSTYAQNFAGATEHLRGWHTLTPTKSPRHEYQGCMKHNTKVFSAFAESRPYYCSKFKKHLAATETKQMTKVIETPVDDAEEEVRMADFGRAAEELAENEDIQVHVQLRTAPARVPRSSRESPPCSETCVKDPLSSGRCPD